MRLLAVSAALALLVGACRSPRGLVESFPPIACSVEDAGGAAQTVSVTVDGDPATVRAGDLTFGVEYRSHPDGRVLETTVRRASGDVVERVTYLVPGRTSLRNQFGQSRTDVTGQHEVDPEGADRLRWSCTVDRGDQETDRS